VPNRGPDPHRQPASRGCGAGRVDLLIIDGYVHLNPHGRPGLGAHLHAWLGVRVIGVAKTSFHTASHAIKVRRGQARRPL
jgi:deoxyribonuclease V